MASLAHWGDNDDLVGGGGRYTTLLLDADGYRRGGSDIYRARLQMQCRAVRRRFEGTCRDRFAALGDDPHLVSFAGRQGSHILPGERDAVLGTDNHPTARAFA